MQQQQQEVNILLTVNGYDFYENNEYYAVLYHQPGSTKKWNKIDQTEAITNNPDPVWKKTFKVKFFFSILQKYKFVIYGGLKKGKMIGEIEFLLGELVGSNHSKLRTPLYQNEKQIQEGEIEIFGEEFSALDTTSLLNERFKNLKILDSNVGEQFEEMLLQQENEEELSFTSMPIFVPNNSDKKNNIDNRSMDTKLPKRPVDHALQVKPITIKGKKFEDVTFKTYQKGEIEKELKTFDIKYETVKEMADVEEPQTVDLPYSITIEMEAFQLVKEGIFGKLKPFVKVLRPRGTDPDLNDSSSWIEIGETEYIQKSKKFRWKPITIKYEDIAGKEETKKLMFACYNWKKNNKSVFVGRCVCTVGELISSSQSKRIQEEKTIEKEFDFGNDNELVKELVNRDKKLKSKKYVNSGMINFSCIENLKATQVVVTVQRMVEVQKEISRTPKTITKKVQVWNEVIKFIRRPAAPLIYYVENASYLNYIERGLEINLMISIDFTGSNGSKQSGLHQLYKNNRMNGYQQSIDSIGRILGQYDSDQLFPVFGFGANQSLGPKHCFPLNGNDDDPEVKGLDGVMDAYKKVLQGNTITFGGPTNFAPSIQKCREMVTEDLEENPNMYYILLILTDGEITDFNNTSKEIVLAARDLPIAIVIVGIGDADFSKMDRLDGDDVRISYQDEEAKRDIVQFVPLRDFTKNGNLDMEGLTMATLEELPDQIVEYFKFSNKTFEL
ncbi:copine-8 [Anaeramoeba flamelloides]|uniref:Copine-8 n=1 Tax=Anaeramoeba flamelloides TaxID=1746091 RepID=A0ABQ8Z7R8_9EUKA|nr:copine-8 [Anaeramoeba flamelloides]